MKTKLLALISLSTLGAIVAIGCGGSSGSPTTSEAQSAATGDIPDNQVFLTFHDKPAGYSISYPEGWSQKGSGADVTFSDKDNTIHVTVASGPAPTVASAKGDLAKLKRSDPSVSFGPPQQVTIKGAPVIKTTYTTLSPPDPVTGKRLTLTVDRYQYAHNGKRATVDLGTVKGVDNVDAYRMISQGFKWG